jgi:hypothetical protein
MRRIFLFLTWLILALAVQALAQPVNPNLAQAQVNAIMATIHSTQVSEVPNGECFSGICYTQNALAGDIIIADAPNTQATGPRGTLTDKDGNQWTLNAGVPCQTNTAGDWWWGNVTGGPPGNSMLQCGYNIAIRLTNDGHVWVEEAKQGGWWDMTATCEAGCTFGLPVTYVGDPGPGPNNTGGGGGGPPPPHHQVRRLSTKCCRAAMQH